MRVVIKKTVICLLLLMVVVTFSVSAKPDVQKSSSNLTISKSPEQTSVTISKSNVIVSSSKEATSSSNAQESSSSNEYSSNVQATADAQGDETDNLGAYIVGDEMKRREVFFNKIVDLMSSFRNIFG